MSIMSSSDKFSRVVHVDIIDLISISNSAVFHVGDSGPIHPITYDYVESAGRGAGSFVIGFHPTSWTRLHFVNHVDTDSEVDIDYFYEDIKQFVLEQLNYLHNQIPKPSSPVRKNVRFQSINKENLRVHFLKVLNLTTSGVLAVGSAQSVEPESYIATKGILANIPVPIVSS